MTKEEISRFSDTICLLESEEKDSDLSAVETHTGLCPSGHGLLIRARIEIEPPLFLERCTDCGGIWFDRGEWNRLAENELLKDLPEFWTRAWQRKQRKETSRKLYIEWQQKTFGEELYALLSDLAERLKNHPRRSEALAFIREEILGERDKKI